MKLNSLFSCHFLFRLFLHSLFLCSNINFFIFKSNIDEERADVHAEVGNIGELVQLPNLEQCLAPIRKCASLKNRTPQLKVWIDKQRKKIT